MWHSDVKNDIAQDIEDGEEIGRYLDCLNLEILELPYHKGGFETTCAESSIQYPESPYRAVIAAGDACCPKGCRLFRDRSAAEKEKRRAEAWIRWRGRLLWLPSHAGRFFSWFAGASAGTQALLLLIVLAIFAPRLATAFAEVLKALLK